MRLFKMGPALCAATLMLSAPAALAQDVVMDDLYLDDYATTANAGADVHQQVNLGSNFGSQSNSNVQINIDNTRVIESGNNVDVSHSVNGVNTAYGLGGASVMGTITAKTNETAYWNSQRHNQAMAVSGAILGALGLPNY